MTTTPTPEDFDTATVRMIFALRDSLTDQGPSRLDFWSGGRAIAAISAAAAGAETAGHAITIAAHKLQIDQIHARHAQTVVDVAGLIDRDYPAWAEHIARHGVYILALADVERQSRKTTKEIA